MVKHIRKPYSGKQTVRFYVVESGEIQIFALLSEIFRNTLKILVIKSEFQERICGRAGKNRGEKSEELY